MVTRISGLGSGYDIDSMVSALMQAQRIPLDKLNQNKTLLEWKKDDYSTTYNSINDLYTKLFDYTQSATVLPLQATSSNESVATMTAAGSAATVSHTLVVTQLAAGANVTSADSLGSQSDKTSLSAQFAGNPSLPGADFNIVINGKTIAVKTGESINTMIVNINAAGAGVKASYDSNLDRVFINSTATGAAATIDFTGTDANGQAFLKDVLKFVDGSGSLKTVTAGQDAAFTLDGVDLTAATNNFAIANVSYTLKSAGTTSISVSTDVDTIVKNVKSFVDSYNSLLSSMNTEVNEKRNRDYLPLTDTQKGDMKDSEITAWEAKAKSGMLYHDSILNTTIDKIRTDIYTPVSGITGTYNSLSSLGITTGGYYENGKLYLDEDKLRTALADDPQAVSKLFVTSGTTSSTKGVVNRLRDDLKAAMDNIGSSDYTAKSIQESLAKQIKDYNSRISDLTNRLTDIETRYYRQFDAMDQLVQQMNQQSSWLSQFTSG